MWGFSNSHMSWLLAVDMLFYVLISLRAVPVMYPCISLSVCVRSLFPSLLHPRPSSLPSTCRRSILTRWSSTSLWVHIPQHLIASSPPHSPSPPSLSVSFCVMDTHCIIHANESRACCSSRQTDCFDRLKMFYRRCEGQMVQTSDGNVAAFQ